MKKSIIAIGVLAAFAWTLPAAYAGGLGVSGNAGVTANANAQTRGPSVSAQENANGSFAVDRDFGRDRAQERMSVQGKAHSQASVAAKKREDRRAERLDTARANAALAGSANVDLDARRALRGG
jgi:hypothetical protein